MRFSLRSGGNRRLLIAGSPLVVVAGMLTGVGIAAHAAGGGGSSCNGNQQPPNPNGSVEALLADLSPSAGSTVSPGDTITVVYTDETPIASGTPFSVTVGGASVSSSNITITSTSGQPQNYIQPSDGGSQGNQCQDFITFTVPSNTATGGNETVTATVYDSDNNQETVSWTYNIPSPTPSATPTATPTAPPTPTPTPKPTPGIVTSQSLTPNDEGFVLNGEGATGTMTFKLYAPGSNCSGTPVFSQVVHVTDGVAETTNTSYIATAPGTWKWVVVYSGDATHPAARSGCGAEKFVLNNG